MSDVSSECLKVLRRISIVIGIALTLVVFCFMCCTPRRHHVSLLFATNLLISNLVLIGFFIYMELMPEVHDIGIIIAEGFVAIGCYFAVMNGCIIRMCIAAERYLIIAHPTYIRGTRTSVLAFVGPWVYCFLIFYLGFALWPHIIVYLAFLPQALLSFIFIILTFVALPAATSVAIEEKQRTVGVLFLLLVDYILLIIAFSVFFSSFLHLASVLLGMTVFVDLTLSVLMFKGPVDKCLSRLCYSMMGKLSKGDSTCQLVTYENEAEVQ